jgi:hypothetical protein
MADADLLRAIGDLWGRVADGRLPPRLVELLGEATSRCTPKETITTGDARSAMTEEIANTLQRLPTHQALSIAIGAGIKLAKRCGMPLARFQQGVRDCWEITSR